MLKRKVVSVSVVALGLAGLSFTDSQTMDVSAEMNGYNSVNDDWANHNEVMNDHMSGGGMHGRNFRNEEWNRSNRNRNDTRRPVTEDRNQYESRRSDYNDRNNHSWRNAHRTTWGWLDSSNEDGERDELNYSTNFFENMWGYMRDFTDNSVNSVNSWMNEMHGSFDWNW
ncbi:hypothetical protein [Alkalibacterium kapii]|uniref:Uncharacterized protein n=1 Tax=Alkalibacterium kapii TaxID=426704 RepID=A0A511AUD2_9LACT|nr:hypothetical protein [Alkalibacterium kapii]GEK91744.1 hypothetical protein AKA01nite_13660 [Alkalibacterium kapii]